MAFAFINLDYDFVVCGQDEDLMFYNYNIEDVVMVMRAGVLPSQMMSSVIS